MVLFPFRLDSLVYVYTVFRIIISYLDFWKFFLISFPVKVVPLSILMDCGIPLGVIFCSRRVFAVFLVGVPQKHAAGHLLYRSIDTSMKNRFCLNLIGPIKSNWISWFVLLVGCKQLISVIGNWGFTLLPVILQDMHSSHFYWNSLPIWSAKWFRGWCHFVDDGVSFV